MHGRKRVVETKVSENEGKVFYMLGDSYVMGNHTPYNKVAYALSSATIGLKYHNKGINGTTVAEHTDPNKQFMVVRYREIGSDAEIIGVEGGRNDYNASIPIGKDTDTVSTTFKGALNIIFKNLKATHPNAKIFAVPCWEVTTPKNKAGYTQNDYLDAMVHVAGDLHGLPVLDVKNVGVNMNDPAFLAAYTEDGNSVSHLNEAGHIKFSKYLTKFLIDL